MERYLVEISVHSAEKGAWLSIQRPHTHVATIASCFNGAGEL